MLFYKELKALVDAGVIEGVEENNINGASIDVTLGDVFWVEDQTESPSKVLPVVDLARKEVPRMIKHTGPIIIPPGGFVLAQTREVFHLPNNVSFHYMLKSSQARAGLEHLFAGFADPTWHGSVLTLEFVNSLQHHSLKLTPGMKAGQIVMFKGSSPVPEHKSYAVKGQYNKDTSAQPSRGVR